MLKSPLRYPGSKQKLTKFFLNFLELNDLKPELLIEPFAGGLSVSIFSLENNLCEKIAFIEKDILLYSFWKVVFNDTKWLINAIKNLEINIESWQIFKNSKPKNKKELALKCIFLNRTCFSGILKAGPIGGYEQKSKYKIDCRFNKKDIIEKIEQLSKFKKRILFIENGDYYEILKNKKLPKNSFFYIDPPYFNKAKSLYNCYFSESEHITLCSFIKQLQFNWLLSYDYDERLKQMYSFANIAAIQMSYSATSKSNRPKKLEFLASNLSFGNLNNI